MDVGVSYGMELPGEDLFYVEVHPSHSSGPPPLPTRADRLHREPAHHFWQGLRPHLPPGQAADGYKAIDEHSSLLSRWRALLRSISPILWASVSSSTTLSKRSTTARSLTGPKWTRCCKSI